MSAALKHFFDEGVVRGIGRDLVRAGAGFTEEAFVAACVEGLEERELLARAWHIADVMERLLPTSFEAASRLILASLGPELVHTEGNALAPFRYLPHVFFVQKHGLDDFELAMHAQYELTKRLTAEFSIRPFLVRHPERTLQRLREWTSDPNVHVRRLVSEGTRPRLPWAPRLPDFIRDPAPVLALLELLRHDPERYVQRSVANNLNDIAKDHPALVVATCRRWAREDTPGMRFVVRHALRSLVKRGDRGALALLGAGARPKVKVSRLDVPERVRLGGELRWGFSLSSASARAQELVVDFAVYFAKANGKARPKVFKLRRLSLPARARVDLASRVSFAPLTTRRHYPGPHQLEVLINGVPCARSSFNVVP